MTDPTFPELDPPKGLRLDLYTNAKYAGCSNDGISAHCDQVTLIGIVDTTKPGNAPRNGPDPTVDPLPRDCRVFSVRDDAPPVWLVIRDLGGRRVYHLAPTTDGVLWRWMAGGAYASGDSRFSALAGNIYGAVPLHDRTES